MLFCCECKKLVNARLTNGKEIYPHRPDLYDKPFYICPICGNYTGCHKGTTNALGSIPNRELRTYRQNIHALLDPLWKSKRYKRKYLYGLISKNLGYTYHTGNIGSKEEYQKVLQIVKDLMK